MKIFEGGVNIFLVDAHVDTITNAMANNWELRDNPGHLSLCKLEGAPVIFFAIFYHKEKNDSLFNRFLAAYDFLKQQVEKNASRAAMALSYSDILRNIKDGKVSAVPCIEEGGILEGKPENLHKAAGLGVRYITLTWNFVNELGEPSALNGGGLTPLGIEFVKEMNRLNVLADVSHLSVPGFWDVYKTSKKPFIASHSNAKAICGHHRNLDDDQLKAIGEVGGCAGINFNPPFLSQGFSSENRLRVTVDDVFRHADHMLKLAGEDSVGIGSDFDGISFVPEGLEDASKFPALYDAFQKRYGAGLTDKIFYKNFMRVLETTI